MTAKRDLRRRQDRDFNFGHQLANTHNLPCKSLSRPCLISPMHEPRRNIAAVGYIHLFQAVLALIELVQLPLGRVGMQMSHTLPDQRGASRRQEELQSFDD